jgi:hypothetical protein
MIVSHLNCEKYAFQYHYISLLLLYILCPSDSRLGSTKCSLVLFSNVYYYYIYHSNVFSIFFLRTFPHC